MHEPSSPKSASSATSSNNLASSPQGDPEYEQRLAIVAYNRVKVLINLNYFDKASSIFANFGLLLKLISIGTKTNEGAFQV